MADNAVTIGSEAIRSTDDGTAQHQHAVFEYLVGTTLTVPSAANPLPVAGTVDLGATDNAVLDSIVTNTTGLAGCVGGSEMQVDVVASLPAGSNAIGKLAANSGVDIGDVDVTSVVPGTGATALGKAVDSAAGGTDTGVATLAIRDDSLSSITPAEGDYAPLRVDANGALWIAPSGTQTISGTVSGNLAVSHETTNAYDGSTSCTIKEFMVIGAAASSVTLVAAVSGKKIRLLSLSVIATTATANSFYLMNGDYNVLGSSAALIPIAMDADGDNIAGYNTPPGFRRTTDTANEALVAVQGHADEVIYCGTYIEVD